MIYFATEAKVSNRPEADVKMTIEDAGRIVSIVRISKEHRYSIRNLLFLWGTIE